ncbi:MAG: Ycf66 family protein [Scytolyngbya sp. HA4215-MV1]|jgi:hypothetical protein|nr:Ycf66 family protein [Scytolyngbya sp. HA4215-MV1]
MLAYVLALVVGLGSFALYMAAFFFPEVHRKGDLIWSGVGLFYALVLWVCAGRITGGVLLGQIAGVALLGWFGWQTLTLRRSLTPTAQQTEVNQAELQEKLSTLVNSEQLSKLSEQASRQMNNVKDWTQAIASTLSQPKEKSPPSVQPYVPTTPPDFATTQSAESVPVEDSLEELPVVESAQVVPSATDPWSDAGDAVEGTTDPPDATASLSPSVLPKTVAEAPKTNLFGTLLATIQSAFKSFNQPKNKSTYVRKQFRSDDEAEESLKGAIAQDAGDDWADESIAVTDEIVIPDENLPLTEASEASLIENPSPEPSLETLEATIGSKVDLETAGSLVEESSLEFLLDDQGKIEIPSDAVRGLSEPAGVDDLDVLFAESDDLSAAISEVDLELEALTIELDPNLLVSDQDAEASRDPETPSEPAKDG